MLYRAPILITAVANMQFQGAGNVFKGDEAEQAKHAANDSAVDDKVEGHALKDKPEGLAAKGKALFFGKKDKDQTAKS